MAQERDEEVTSNVVETLSKPARRCRVVARHTVMVPRVYTYTIVCDKENREIKNYISRAKLSSISRCLYFFLCYF